MEVLGTPSIFRFPFFLPNKLAFRRLPPASTPFRSPPPPHLSHAPPPQLLGNRRLAVPCAVHPTPPAPDEDETRAILRHLIQEDDDGMCSALEEQKALEIVEHLSSRLRSLHESEQQLGIQLKVPQLVDVFTLYLRSILKEYRDISTIMVGDVQLPSSAPDGERTAEDAPTRWAKYKNKAFAKLEMQLSEGCPPPHILCLMNLGLNLGQILSMGRKFPILATTAIKPKLDHVMEFLISLGVPKSDVPMILHRCPQLIAFKIENRMPLMALLESKGVHKAHWPEIIYFCPKVLTLNKAKIEAIVGYFSETGLSPSEVKRLLTRTPQVLCFSIEKKIKLTNRILLDIGFTMEDIHVIILRVWNFYGFQLERNLKPKWDFFLVMGYPKSDILKYPEYFGYSLEKRIKPRYERAAKLGIRWSLPTLLVSSNVRFEKMIKKKMREMQNGCH